MPTIKDVALKAGVSVTTVSRVLNNRGYLSEELKKKVLQAMDELNYRPNELARSLSRSRSNIIGLIIPSVAHPFSGSLPAILRSMPIIAAASCCYATHSRISRRSWSISICCAPAGWTGSLWAATRWR